MALGYPKAQQFNTSDTHAFRALVVWLENTKVLPRLAAVVHLSSAALEGVPLSVCLSCPPADTTVSSRGPPGSWGRAEPSLAGHLQRGGLPDWPMLPYCTLPQQYMCIKSRC
jgi:hypothetical protein